MTKNPATEAFEAWARKQMRYPVANPDFSLNDNGDYKNHYVQADWETWQAAYEDMRIKAVKVCENQIDPSRPNTTSGYAYWHAEEIKKIL